MKFSEAKELVKAYPKFIGGYRRQRFTGLKEVTVVNWMMYENKFAQCRLAASIGDDSLYKIDLVGSGSSPKIATPGKERIC